MATELILQLLVVTLKKIVQGSASLQGMVFGEVLPTTLSTGGF